MSDESPGKPALDLKALFEWSWARHEAVYRRLAEDETGHPRSAAMPQPYVHDPDAWEPENIRWTLAELDRLQAEIARLQALVDSGPPHPPCPDCGLIAFHERHHLVRGFQCENCGNIWTTPEESS